MATRKKKFYCKIVSTTKRRMGGRIQKAGGYYTYRNPSVIIKEI